MGEFKDRIITVMDELGAFVRETKSFTHEEAPKAIRELLTYEWVSGWFGMAIYGFLLGASSFATWKIYLSLLPEDSLGKSLLLGACVVVASGSLVSVVCQIDMLIKIRLAPRIFLIEYVVEKTKELKEEKA